MRLTLVLTILIGVIQANLMFESANAEEGLESDLERQLRKALPNVSALNQPVWQRFHCELAASLLEEERKYDLPYKWFLSDYDAKAIEINFVPQCYCLCVDRSGKATEFFLTHLEDPDYRWDFSCGDGDAAKVSNVLLMKEAFGIFWPPIRKHLTSTRPEPNLIALAELWMSLDREAAAEARLELWRLGLETDSKLSVGEKKVFLANLRFIESLWTGSRQSDPPTNLPVDSNWMWSISVPFSNPDDAKLPPEIEEKRSILRQRGAEVRKGRTDSRGTDPRLDLYFQTAVSESAQRVGRVVEKRLEIVDDYLDRRTIVGVIGRSPPGPILDPGSKSLYSSDFAAVGFTPKLNPSLHLFKWVELDLLWDSGLAPGPFYQDAHGNLDSDRVFQPHLAAMALARLGHQTIREREIDGEVISPVLKHMQKPATDDNLEWVGKVIDYIDSNQMAKFRTELWIKEREKLIAEKPEKIIPEKRFFRGKEGGWIYRGFHFAIKDLRELAYSSEQDRVENEVVSTMINALDEPTQKEWLARTSGKPVEGSSGKLPPEIEELLPKQVPEDDLVLKQLRKLREFLDKNKMVDISER